MKSSTTWTLTVATCSDIVSTLGGMAHAHDRSARSREGDGKCRRKRLPQFVNSKLYHSSLLWPTLQSANTPRHEKRIGSPIGWAFQASECEKNKERRQAPRSHLQNQKVDRKTENRSARASCIGICESKLQEPFVLCSDCAFRLLQRTSSTLSISQYLNPPKEVRKLPNTGTMIKGVISRDEEGVFCGYDRNSTDEYPSLVERKRRPGRGADGQRENSCIPGSCSRNPIQTTVECCRWIGCSDCFANTRIGASLC